MRQTRIGTNPPNPPNARHLPSELANEIALKQNAPEINSIARETEPSTGLFHEQIGLVKDESYLPEVVKVIPTTKAVVFDIDGTLNTMQYWTAVKVCNRLLNLIYLQESLRITKIMHIMGLIEALEEVRKMDRVRPNAPELCQEFKRNDFEILVLTARPSKFCIHFLR